LHRNKNLSKTTTYLKLTYSRAGVVATPGRRGIEIRAADSDLGGSFNGSISDTIGRAALMLAAFAPLLAGCEEPYSAVAAAQTSDPDVSIVIVKPQARALVRELPGVWRRPGFRCCPARVRIVVRAPFQSRQRG